MAILSLTKLLGRVRSRSQAVGTCMACGQPVLDREPSMRTRGVYVHRRCATYRMRQLHGRTAAQR